MSETTLCMGCMQPLPDGREECGLCGYPASGENPPEFLPVGSRLSDRYLVGRVLSVCGDTATYIGLDLEEKTPLWVQEFLPLTLCKRGDNRVDVEPLVDSGTAFGTYLVTFRQHIRALARLRELPILVPIFDIFEQNGTVYAVSDAAEGTPLPQYMQQQGGRLSWEDARRLFLPLLNALVTCHAAGMYHFGIAPDRLLINSEGRLLLTGFSLPQTRSVNTDLKPSLQSGFSAPEQYDFAGALCPATDVYGIAATLFFALSGHTPPAGDARDPQGRDLLLPREVSSRLPTHVAAALDAALRANVAGRTQSVQELRDSLSSGAVVQSLSDTATVNTEPMKAKTSHKKSNANDMRKYALWGMLGIILVIILIAAIIIKAAFFSGDDGDDTQPTASTTVVLPPTTTESRTPLPSGAVLVAPKLAGNGTDYFSLSVSASGYRYEDFAVELDGLAYSDLPYGTIVSQSPAAGEHVSATTPIRVVISVGPRPSVIPTVKGWKAEHAQKYLEALGFKVTFLEEEVVGVPRGEVIGTLPEEGRTVDAGKGNAVTLRVSTWEEPAEPAPAEE